MQKGENLNKVNVITVCLGIHVPSRVTNRMLRLAEITLDTELPGKAGEENSIYDLLIRLKWATDYQDIYEELENQDLEHLIKEPKRIGKVN